MTGEDSAYAILGLRPGAGRAELNNAYRRLMKRHHPDRPGGDADRAAEINRAYTLLRRRLGEPVRMPVEVPVQRRAGGSRVGRVGWLLTFAIVGAAAALANQDAPSGSLRLGVPALSQWTGPAKADADLTDVSRLASFDDPVQQRGVTKAIADAVRFHSGKDIAGAAAYSRECQISLRRERSVGWFDTCAAFDEAMLTLVGGSDQAESGPFDEAAVVTREITASRIVSDDSLGADSHLHQIRSQVDIEILPMLDSAAAIQL